MTASVGREMNVLLEVRGLKKIKKLSSCRRGGSVAMDVKITRDYEFRGVRIKRSIREVKSEMKAENDKEGER